MAAMLGVVAVLTLVTTLISVIVAIWLEEAPAAQFLELTRILLSWDKLAAALVVGGSATFYSQIRKILEKAGSG
jgi:hypothetical protein